MRSLNKVYFCSLNIGKKLSDGKSIKGDGRLTNAKIDVMQGFYGKAKATRAILKHYASTPENPQRERNHGAATRKISLAKHGSTNQSKVLYPLQWLKLPKRYLTSLDVNDV